MPLTQVSGGGLADDSVNAAKIATGAVTVADIPDGEITNAKIGDGEIQGGKLHSTIDLPDAATAHTQTAGTNNTTIATTAYVDTADGNKLNTSGGTITGNLTLNAQNELRLADSDSSNYIALKSPATVASDVTLTLPDSVGTAGQFLQVGAGGVTTWATALNLILQTDAAVADALIGSASSCTNPVILSGTLPYSYTYQWQFAPSGSSTFTNISGATSQTYVVPSTINSSSAAEGQIRCVVTVTDSTTPALTITSTSNAVTIEQLFHGTAGRAYRYEHSTTSWVSVTVNSSATTSIRNHNRMGGGYNVNLIVTDSNQVFAESATDVYNTNVTTNFGGSSYTSQGVRNIATSNNPTTVASHCVLNDDIVFGSYAGSSWTSMRATYPGATCIWLANMGWCSNNAWALIDDNGTERLINVWARNFTGSSLSAYQDLGLVLPNNEKLKQVVACGNDTAADTEAVVLLSDAGTLYTVGNAANHLDGAVNTGTFASPALYNPTGMVTIAEIKSTGAYTTTNGEGLLAKGTDGHLYGATDDATHPWAKLLDDVATPGMVNQYGSNLIVPMQDGTFRWLTSSSLGVARPYTWATIQSPSGLTVDTSGWTVWPTHNSGSCSPSHSTGSMVLAIPYS